ncbi:MAG TPA: DUF1800 domain-containing protein [Burkholderiaceae bacterium]|nr:DUF1800 domain-containing protein [Burkholderiaceae bacterium]
MSVLAAALLAACGGGNNSSTANPQSARSGSQGATRERAQGAGHDEVQGTNHADAFRLLTQATFGPTDADLANVQASGVASWIDQQEALPLRYSFLQRWNSDNALLSGTGGASSTSVDSGIYQAALQSDDQLRQRVTLALSEIFVVSMQDLGLSGAKSQTAAAYYDTLQQDAFGNYRTLLQDVALSPAMGEYLSMLGNPLENPRTGRIPDQNFAREVMQLFSIGLLQLNLDGTPKLDGNGNPGETYGPDDIDGLSRVFTGWSWYGPDKSPQRFKSAQGYLTPDRLYTPMQDYPDFHSLSEKNFLGTTIPAQQTPDAPGNLKIAFDALFNHPNTGPFISKQLIQRLVTSNPSPAYVARVATVFNDDGNGTRGNLAAVVKAILLDAEARDPGMAQGPGFGKLREPVLRLTAFLRAYHATSDSGLMLIGSTDDPGTALDQSPLRAPTVFNFFRPEYVNAGGQTAANGLVAPEMQITSETSIAGYVNYMMAGVRAGVGMRGLGSKASRPDVQPDYTAATALANDSSLLVPDVCARLVGDTVDADLITQIRAAVDSIKVPAWNKEHTNGQQIANALGNRVQVAVLLALASPEYITQK